MPRSASATNSNDWLSETLPPTITCFIQVSPTSSGNAPLPQHASGDDLPTRHAYTSRQKLRSVLLKGWWSAQDQQVAEMREHRVAV